MAGGSPQAVSIRGQAYELKSVATPEADLVVEDSRGGLKLRAAVLRRRFVRGPYRIARFAWDLLAVH
jgi:hypothetical protein